MDNLLFKSGNSGQVNIDEAQGIVECFVAGIGNKDSVGDVVISGAFAKSLLRRKPRVVWGHSWNDPIGKVLEMYEVPVGDYRLPAKMRNAGIGGLYAKVQFNLNSEKGKEAFATVAFFGEDQEWSIGYKTIDSVFDPNLQANILKEVELYEVSPVLHGANQLTGTISIKGDEKGHMPIIPMPGMGAPMMQEMPRIVVIAAPQEDANSASEGNPFAEGMSQELSQPDKMALQAELTERTGSKIEVMNATENTVVFRRTTQDGKASMYRLPYHREGGQYMFGKPEPYTADNPAPQPIQNIEQKPGAPVVVPNGGIAYRNDDQQEMISMFANENMVQSPWGKSDVSHLIELPESYMASAKDFISPVLRHHKLAARPNAKGIVIDGLLTANALDALQNAVKALGATLGQTSGNIGQAIGKIRDLAQTFNPYALDGDGDGFVQDGSAFQRPYIPVKKPGFDLPDVRGRKRSGDALLDKPRSAPKLPKDKNTWTRAQRNEALLAGIIEPETREDVSFLANRRPENEGLAKYWDMSEADLTKEGNRLVNARRQATGAEKEKIDEELLKVSHEFQRRASYAETFGQEFVPPAKREAPEAMVPEADKPKPAKPGRTEAEGLASAGKVFDALNTDDLTDGKGYREWDDLSDNEKFDMFEEVQYDYLYDRYGGLGDDGLVDAMESGDYDDEILEHAEEVYNKIKAKREEEGDRAADAAVDRAREEDGLGSRGEETDAEELAQRETDRALDEQADAAIDRALEGFIEKYGEDEFDKLTAEEQDILLEQGRDQARGLASSGSKLHTNTDVLMEIARRDGWKGGDKQPPAKSYRKAQEALDDWSRLTSEERSKLLDNDEPTIKEFVDALLKARENRLAGIRSVQAERRNAERKRRAAEEKLKRQFASGDTSGVDTSALSDYFPEDEYGNLGRAGREYVNAVLTNWAEMSQADRDKAMRDYGTIVDDPDSVVETLRDALNDYGYKNPKIARFLDDAAAESDIFEMTGFESRGKGTFGSNPEDSKAAQIFDAILDKYWKMWGFDVPDEDDKGWDEPFGFASRGNEEEVKQSKLDELVGGVRERLIAELETADPATWKPSWRNDSLPVNPITGKPYRGFNAFWLMMRTKGEDYKTGRFAGFNQLKARGAQVRKGEKGVPILRPQLVKKEDEDGNVKEFVVFRGATVFNIDQTDGGDEALRAIPADLPESQRIAILDETLKELGVNVRTENTTPHYNPDGDYISMPDFAKGTSALEWTSTLAHEAVHWTGHKSRLDRPSLKDYSSDKKVRAYEELIAEIGSAMLLAAHGIDAPFRQDHAPYIKGWISLLKDDPDALGNAFKDAQAAVNHMLEKSPNLRKLFGGLDSGKKAPDVDAPTEVNVPVGASEGFASLHRVRTPGSEVLTGILYDDNSGELMVGFMKGKSWNDLSEEDRQNWIDKYIESQRNVGGYRAPLSDSQIDDIARDLYDDSREIGWYVYSDVSMEEVNELAAVKSKGRHINALKKLKKARKASDEDKFNFFGRDERVQDVAKKQVDGFASRGPAEPNEGLRRHKLMPADIREKMPELYSTEDVDLNDKMVVAKFFSPYSNWTWYAVEFDGEDTFFGYVEGFEGEWGNFSLNELAGAQLRNGVPAVERDMSFRPTKFGELMTSDGFASSGSKRIGIEPQYSDPAWIDKTQQRILKQNTDWNSLSHDDQIDWANSFLDEYLRENEMGHGLSDVANGRRLNGRPDIELLNYAEQAYARMSDAHASRRAQFGEEEGLASVGRRTRRLGIKPSNAVDYVSYDPEGENLFVAYKREDGRSDMYVYEGVSMDDAIGVENAQSVGKAINDIKRRKNVRKATPEEIIGLSESEVAEGAALKRAKAINTVEAIYGSEDHRTNRNLQLEINADRISVGDDGTTTWESADDTMRYTISPTDDGGYLVTAEKLSRGGREEPDTFETVFSTKESSREDAITALFNAAKTKIADDDEEAKLDRELDAAKRELDMAGDAPGVETVDVTYSSALDAVDYNPSTQELRVSYRDGGTYIYEGVDRTSFEEFKSAPSKGRAMNDIKRAHPYRKDTEWTGGIDEDGGVEEFDVRGSQAVEKVSYDPEKEDLLVVYAGGKGYVYTGVTREEADAVRSAPSKGRAINDIKRTHEVRLLAGEDIRHFGGKKDSAKKDEVTTSDEGELRAFIDEQEGLLEVMELNGESAEKLARQREIVEKAKRDLSAMDTTVIDPAPVAKPKMPTRKPPRGGKRVRNRNVVIEMEQGTLDEIMEAESKNITVDELRDAAGSVNGKYTKGPRKGKNRGSDTITVRDAETGELLHANEILLTSSVMRGSPTAANRKRGYIRARSYAGRQGHQITKDEGPSLRGEGRGMTDYDKRVYGLGSDEKNREYGLASAGGRVRERGSRVGEDINDFRRYLDSEYGEYFMEYTQMDDEELKQTLMTRYRMSRGEARDLARQIRRDEKYYYDLWEQEDLRLNDLDSLGYDGNDGFASGPSRIRRIPRSNTTPMSVQKERGTGYITVSAMVTGGRGASEEDRGTRRMQITFSGGSPTEAKRNFLYEMDDRGLVFAGEDGFASRSYDPSKNLAPERWVGYGIERYGNFSKEELINDLESIRNRDRDEAERIADYWKQSDALWDEYFEEAIGDEEGNVERAFSLAADRAYEDYLSGLADMQDDGFASMGQELQDLQSKIQRELINPGSRNGKRNKPIDPDVAANLANPESDAGTLLYPSTDGGDSIRVSYNPEKRKYRVERIEPFEGEEVVVDTADADTSYEAGSLVLEFAENYVNDLRSYENNDGRAATYESTFGRGGDADDGFASRGQRLGEIRPMETAGNNWIESAQLSKPLDIINLEDDDARERFEEALINAGALGRTETSDYLESLYDRILVFAPDTDSGIMRTAAGAERRNTPKTRYIVPTKDKKYAIVEFGGDYDGAPDGGGYNQFYEVVDTSPTLGSAIRNVQRLEQNDTGASADNDGFASGGKAPEYDISRLDAPVVRGEKSPILDLSPRAFDSFYGGGSKFNRRSEQTYDIYGPVSMPIAQPESVFNTQFADQIVKDFSRSDLTIDELADRFDLTPTQVQEVLNDARLNINALESLRDRKRTRGLGFSDDYDLRQYEKVEKLFVGDRKHTDIPELTGEARANSEQRMARRNALAQNEVTRRKRNVALKELANTKDYREAQSKYDGATTINARRLFNVKEHDRIENDAKKLEGTDQEKNLSLLLETLSGEDLIQILNGIKSEDFKENWSDPTGDWFEDDYGTLRDVDGDEVSYENLDIDDFDIDFENLSPEVMQEISDAVEFQRGYYRRQAQKAKSELGLSEDASVQDVARAIKDQEAALQKPLDDMERELLSQDEFALLPVPDEVSVSSLYGIVDSDGNKVDFEKLPTQYRKRQDALIASYNAQRAASRAELDAELNRGDQNLEDGFASRYSQYEGGWDAVAETVEIPNRPERATPMWDDLDYDQQNEFIHEVDYDYMYDNHSNLGDDGIVEAMEDGRYDDAINEHAARVWDTIADRKENQRLVRALEGTDADPEERASIAKYWSNSDALHDKYMKQANGNLGEAMNLAYEDHLSSLADMQDDGFASQSNKPLTVWREWTNFEDLDAAEQDEIIQNHIDSIDRVAQPDIDLEEERDFAIEQWNEEARGARAEAAESLLTEINELWDQDADADNPFQRNGNLAYAEELVKNTSYVEDVDLAEAQNIVDEVRERFEARKKNSVAEELSDDEGDGDGFASSGMPNDGYQLMRRGNRDFLSDEFSRDEYRSAMSGLDKVRKNTGEELTTEESRAIRKLADLYRGSSSTRPTQQDAINDVINSVNSYRPSRTNRGEGFASRMTEADRNDLRADIADYPDGYEADMANMAAQEVQNNFARLSADDQNMYLQRALANNAESGMTTEQILEEAKKLAMDDRRMAELERQAIGMGQSSKPRKIDVSSSSALNSVEYDEMNQRLSVEYRGRDGKGTGTVYNYDGVEPEVVDRLEAADSRGATMREVRDNYEFTTSRKLPDSAYEGLASRGSRKSTAEYQNILFELPDPKSGPARRRYMAASDGARSVVEDRYALIHARRQIAKEMAEANGVEWKDGVTIFDVAADDDDDLDILMQLDDRIEELNKYVTANDREYRRVRNMEQLVLQKESELDDIKEGIDLAIEEFDLFAEDNDVVSPEENLRDLTRNLKRNLDDLEYHENENDRRSLAIEYSDDIAKVKKLIGSGTPEDLRQAAETMQEIISNQKSNYKDQYKYYEYEGDDLLDSGYRVVDSLDEESDLDSDGKDGWDYSASIDEEDGSLSVIADELYGPEPKDQKVVAEYMGMSTEDGFASGGRRRPGRRNQGGRGQRMAPVSRYSAEDRQALADGNILRSRKRPAKRRQPPDQSEWEGFASTNLIDDDSPDMAVDPRGAFEGGEHGPGKDISLRKMWENIRKSGENNEWFSESMRAEDLARDLNIPRNVAQALLDARPQSGRPEMFIDNPYLADTLSQRIGMSRTRLFGFDPLKYYDDEGNVASTLEEVDAAIESERARRAARLAAREGRRTGKGDLYRSESSNVDVRDLESKLNIKLTDENGELLKPNALERAARDTGLGWGLEKWRRIHSRGGALTPQDIEELVKRGILGKEVMPERGDLSFEEVFQWPGFADLGSSKIIDALAETLGLNRDEIMKQRRSIQQALTNAKKGQRKAIATRNLQQGKLKLTRAKIAELAERLGLDASEFDRWFSNE